MKRTCSEASRTADYLWSYPPSVLPFHQGFFIIANGQSTLALENRLIIFPKIAKLGFVSGTSTIIHEKDVRLVERGRSIRLLLETDPPQFQTCGESETGNSLVSTTTNNNQEALLSSAICSTCCLSVVVGGDEESWQLLKLSWSQTHGRVGMWSRVPLHHGAFSLKQAVTKLPDWWWPAITTLKNAN